MSLNTKKAKSQPNLRYFCTFLLLILSLVVYSGSDLSQASGETFAAWGLNLPERPVSRRVSQRSEFKGKRTFATLTGPGCIRLCLDCADICAANASIAARKGPLARVIALACAKACETCADECAKHDDATCKACAEECRRCAKVCREAAKRK